jgi:hypothetical protein
MPCIRKQSPCIPSAFIVAAAESAPASIAGYWRPAAREFFLPEFLAQPIDI